MPDPLSINLAHLKASETVAISAETKRRKAAGEDVYDLSVGEPDFDTPAPIRQAAIDAIQKGFTRYPPNIGLPELRTAIARTLSLMSGGRAVNPDHMVVSSGSKQSLFNACFTLFGPGQRVLIPGPAWVSYPQIVHLSRAEPVLVPGDIEWGLKVSVRDLDAAYSKSVKGLILCSPCNPTGAVYTLAELKAIAEWAHKHQVWIISDEIYRRINYGPGPAASMLDLPDELLERTVLIYGASQGLRHDRLAHRLGAGSAAHREGDGGAAVAHHDRRQSSGAVGRGDGVQRRAGGPGGHEDGGGVPPPARPAGEPVPHRGARRGVRRAAWRVLLLLPRRRHPRWRHRVEVLRRTHAARRAWRSCPAPRSATIAGCA